MNKASDMIFRLVKSLNAKEATGFRRSLTVYETNGENNFLILFNALYKTETYNEDIFKENLPKTFRQSNLASLKTQLKNKLIDFLVIHNTGEFKEVHHKLEEVEVLFKRGFYPETTQAIEEAKALITKTALKTYFFIATYFEMCVINYQLGEKNSITSMEKVAAFNATIAAEINLTYTIGLYLARVFTLQAKGNICRTKEDEAEVYLLIEQLCDVRKKSNLTFNQNLNTLTALIRLETRAVSNEKAFEYAVTLHNLIFENYNGKDGDSERFYSLLTDALGAAVSAKKAIEGSFWLKDLERCLQQMPSSQMYSDFYEIYKFKLGALSDLMANRERAFKAFFTYYEKPGFNSAAAKKEAQMSIAFHFLDNKEYGNADYYFNQIIEPAQSTDFFLDQYDFIRVLRLVTLYEQLFLAPPQNLSFESYLLQVDTVYNRIRKKNDNEDYRLEKIMLHFFRSVNAQTSKTERKKLLLETSLQLKPLFEEGPLYIKQISHYFDFLKWVHEKLIDS